MVAQITEKEKAENVTMLLNFLAKQRNGKPGRSRQPTLSSATFCPLEVPRLWPTSTEAEAPPSPCLVRRERGKVRNTKKKKKNILRSFGNKWPRRICSRSIAGWETWHHLKGCRLLFVVVGRAGYLGRLTAFHTHKMRWAVRKDRNQRHLCYNLSFQ